MTKEAGIDEVKEVLGLCVEIERSAGRIYRRFYERFKSECAEGYIWNRLALEEEGHANFFATKIEMLEKIPYAFGAIKRANDEVLKAKGYLSLLEQKIAKDSITLNEAIDIALQVENAVCESEFLELIELSSESLKKAFESVLLETTKHLELIGQLAKANNIELKQ